MIRKFQNLPLQGGSLGRRLKKHKAKLRSGSLPVAYYDEVDYLLCICDWCGKEEVIDPPTHPGPDAAWRAHLKELLNWVSNCWDENTIHDFCCRKCEADFGKRISKYD